MALTEIVLPRNACPTLILVTEVLFAFRLRQHGGIGRIHFIGDEVENSSMFNGESRQLVRVIVSVGRVELVTDVSVGGCLVSFQQVSLRNTVSSIIEKQLDLFT